MMTFKKPYALRHRKTGFIWRGAESRAEARALKRMKGFKHEIVRTSTMQVVR